MKIRTFLVMTICAATAVYAQNVGQLGDSIINYIDINGYKQGHWQKKYENGNIAYDAFFKDNKLVGEYKRYYSAGTQISNVKYDEDGVNGAAVFYWDNGKMMAEGNYIHTNVRDGTWKFYGTDGGFVTEVTYKNGLRDGKSYTYFRDGTKCEEQTFLNDTLDGLWKQYFETGEVLCESRYVKGKRDGVINIYHKSGRPKITGRYVNDVKHGTFKFYDEYGNLEQEVKYINGIGDNESEIDAEFAKEILESEQHKDRYKEPSPMDFMKNNQSQEY